MKYFGAIDQGTTSSRFIVFLSIHTFYINTFHFLARTYICLLLPVGNKTNMQLCLHIKRG